MYVTVYVPIPIRTYVMTRIEQNINNRNGIMHVVC